MSRHKPPRSVPKAARQLIGQAYDAESLKDAFIRAGVRGWLVNNLEWTHDGNRLTRTNTYISEAHKLAVNSRESYGLFRFRLKRIFNPFMPIEQQIHQSIEALNRDLERVQHRAEQGRLRPWDHLLWSINRHDLSPKADDGRRDFVVEVRHGKIVDIQPNRQMIR